MKLLISSLLILTPWVALAHGGVMHGTKPVVKEQKEWGIAGDAKQAKRTVVVTMTDDMRFKPDRLEIKQGETVRFVVKNSGKMMHEMVIGTRKELDEHAVLMIKFPTWNTMNRIWHMLTLASRLTSSGISIVLVNLSLPA